MKTMQDFFFSFLTHFINGGGDVQLTQLDVIIHSRLSQFVTQSPPERVVSWFPTKLDQALTWIPYGICSHVVGMGSQSPS